MKYRMFYVLVAALSLLPACASFDYYQVYEVSSPQSKLIDNSKLVFEDMFCSISYNLWDESGDIGFEFHNNSDSSIYLLLDKCFFVKNGTAYDYFNRQTISNTLMAGTASTRVNNFSTSALVNSSGVSASISQSEPHTITIPSKTSKFIKQYTINNSYYEDCDLEHYPNSRTVKTKDFSAINSPFTFSNRLSYKVGGNGQIHETENSFFVSKITNYPQEDVFENSTVEYCDGKRSKYISTSKVMAPNRFYHFYTTAL